MTEQHKKILTENIEKIASSLCSFQEVLNRLVSDKIMTIEESVTLMTYQIAAQSSTQLVHLLIRKGDKAFEVFHDVLVETHQTALADAIYKGKATTI